MERRGFIKFCAASVAGLGAAEVSADARAQFYGKARLVDEKGAPLRAQAIPVNRNLIFHYPFAATPCFLLNLGKAVRPALLKTLAGQPYEWKGGVGDARSVVAYSAICAHRLSYPTKDISFISYRTEKSARNRIANVIHCCSEHSQYDPAEGARVVAGPAPQPLASILLEWDPASDEIHAVGTLGGEMFAEFFDKYAFRLQLEHGAPRAAVTGSCVVQELDNYCRQQVKC
ncbi:MAG TPA: twin-arginine translocation signal domain-containing protein [Candidatus Limnocylindrales bacterium]|nr:twin-arginine translocation signal domain-containing protein [Candidatus Limnocylindrales bacterium]